jgi:hypothetical protein
MKRTRREEPPDRTSFAFEDLLPEMKDEISQRLDIGTRLCLARTRSGYYDHFWSPEAFHHLPPADECIEFLGGRDHLVENFRKLDPEDQCIALFGGRAHFLYAAKILSRKTKIDLRKPRFIEYILRGLALGDHHDFSGRVLRLDKENKELVIVKDNPKDGSTPYRVLIQWYTKNRRRNCHLEYLDPEGLPGVYASQGNLDALQWFETHIASFSHRTIIDNACYGGRLDLLSHYLQILSVARRVEPISRLLSLLFTAHPSVVAIDWTRIRAFFPEGRFLEFTQNIDEILSRSVRSSRLNHAVVLSFLQVAPESCVSAIREGAWGEEILTGALWSAHDLKAYLDLGFRLRKMLPWREDHLDYIRKFLSGKLEEQDFNKAHQGLHLTKYFQFYPLLSVSEKKMVITKLFRLVHMVSSHENRVSLGIHPQTETEDIISRLLKHPFAGSEHLLKMFQFFNGHFPNWTIENLY